MFRRFVFSAILPLATLVAIGAAEAGTVEQTSVDVSYAGLDLSSPAGAATLRTRIIQAVNEVCGAPDSRDLAAMRRMHECRTDLTSRIEPQVLARIETAQGHQMTAAVPGAMPAAQ